MPKDLFQFPCPCCGKHVEVDTRSGRARAVRPEERRGGGDLDTLVEKHKRDQDRLDSLFADAKDQQARQGERLDQILDDAKRATRDDPDRDKRPPSPFDLD